MSYTWQEVYSPLTHGVDQKTIGYILSCPRPLLPLCMTLCKGTMCVKTEFILQLSHLPWFRLLWEDSQSLSFAVPEGGVGTKGTLGQK